MLPAIACRFLRASKSGAVCPVGSVLPEPSAVWQENEEHQERRQEAGALHQHQPGRRRGAGAHDHYAQVHTRDHGDECPWRHEAPPDLRLQPRDRALGNPILLRVP